MRNLDHNGKRGKKYTNKWTEKRTCELLRKVDDREGWKICVVKSSEMIPPTILESWD